MTKNKKTEQINIRVLESDKKMMKAKGISASKLFDDALKEIKKKIKW